MATLTVQDIVQTGLEASYAAAAGGGDEIPNTGQQFLHVKNGGGSDIVVTITSTATYGGLAVADPTVTVTAGEDRFIGPFPPGVYNNSNGRVAVAYDSVTSVTVAALRLPV